MAIAIAPRNPRSTSRPPRPPIPALVRLPDETAQVLVLVSKAAISVFSRSPALTSLRAATNEVPGPDSR